MVKATIIHHFLKPFSDVKRLHQNLKRLLCLISALKLVNIYLKKKKKKVRCNCVQLQFRLRLNSLYTT